MDRCIRTLYENRKKTLIQVRCGFGRTQKMREAFRAFDRRQCVDIQTITVDSYSRQLQLDLLLNLKAQNKMDDLNGYPALIASQEDLTSIKQSTAKPLQIRHGSPFPYPLWEVTKTFADSFEGGPLGYTLPYSRDADLEKSFEQWGQIDKEIAQKYQQGIYIEREFFGALSSVVLAPEISIFLMLIEAKLAIDNGLRFLTFGFPLSGKAEQDLAAISALRSFSKLLFGHDVYVAIAAYQWMGVFPQTPTGARKLIEEQAAIAAQANVEKLIVKTEVEGFKIPSIEDNARAAIYCKESMKAGNFRVGQKDFLVSFYRNVIDSSVEGLLKSVNFDNLDPEKVIDHIDAGRIDIPFAAHERARNRIRCARDSHGGIRLVDAGDMELDNLTIARAQEMCNLTNEPREWINKAMDDIHFIKTTYDQLPSGT